MREAMAVTGYIATGQVEGLKSAGKVEIRPEKEVAEVLMRVAGSDIDEVRAGGTEGNFTLVQLILKEGATVETAVTSTADLPGFRAFHDPVLNRIRQEATAKKIMV